MNNMCDRDNLLLEGLPPLVPIQKEAFGTLLYNSLVQHQKLHVALKDAVTGETVSYETLLNRSTRLAVGLVDMGLTPGDTIAILSENNVHFFYPIIAAMYSGITVTPFSSNSTSRELIHYCNISQPKVLFCSKSMVKLVNESKSHLHYIENIIIMDSGTSIDDYKTLDDILSNSNSLQPLAFDPRAQKALIMYSSGTTGLPKGVLMTHWNINVNIAILSDQRLIRQYSSGTNFALANLPFVHAYGMTWALYNIYAGNPLIIMNKFDPHIFLKNVQDHKINTLIMVPPLVQFLAKHPMVNSYDLSSVDDMICAAAPVSKDVEKAVRKRLNLKYFRQGLGMTEGVILALTSYEESREGSCGKIVPYLVAKVVDINTRKQLESNQNGEILVKGDSITKGYYENEEATKLAFEDGWFCTGDIGYYDSDGFIFVVDRLKELIKYKGFQVPPLELEVLLATHPKIKEAAVIGLPNERAGELPLAFVVLEPNEVLTEEEVISFIADKVAPEKQLRGGVRFVTEIPKSPIGKVLRKDLRALILKP